MTANSSCLDQLCFTNGLTTDQRVRMISFRTHDIQGLTGVVGGLNRLVNDTVDDGQSVEVEGHSRNGAVADLLVVLIESIKECGAVVLNAVRKCSRGSWWMSLPLHSSLWPS